ncbi:MAG TPA: hypothetical protein VM536_18455 [Chloroflexia bacterium]|nr:hypothetical protein [Chloroflexia bacterium]
MQQPPDTAVPRVVYQAAFESALRGAGVDLRPELVAELETRCGYKVSKPAREYPPEAILAVLRLLIERCFPACPPKWPTRPWGGKHWAPTARRW